MGLVGPIPFAICFFDVRMRLALFSRLLTSRSDTFRIRHSGWPFFREGAKEEAFGFACAAEGLALIGTRFCPGRTRSSRNTTCGRRSVNRVPHVDAFKCLNLIKYGSLFAQLRSYSSVFGCFRFPVTGLFTITFEEFFLGLNMTNQLRAG
jgi:hypothetical protein